MARTVDTSSTFENWRQNYNSLANDVGGLGDLTTGDKSSIVSAINYIMDQYFYFQDFEYDGSDGATSNTVFSGADNRGNTLAYSANKLLVFKNGALLRSGTDYTATNGTSITLASSANNSDVIRFSVFTGSYENVGGATTSSSTQWTLAGSSIYNTNTGGVIINADSTITTTLSHSDTIQLQGDAHMVGHFTVEAISSAPKEIRFNDADNSNYVALLAPTTVSSNFSLKLPTADGSNGQVLTTNGSGQLSFTAAPVATDVNISANNSTDETVYPVFVDGATGTQGIESDTGLTYNPSTGLLTTTSLAGTLTTAAQPNITTVGTIGTGVWQGTAIASGYIANDAITGAKIADDAIDSEHYTDGSIDTAHIADQQITASKLSVTGNGSNTQFLRSDADGTFTWATPTDTTLSTEEVQDIVGAMFSSNTETRISATYEDGDGTIDLVVNDMTANDNTTYTISCVDGDNSDEEKIRLTAGGSGSGTDDVVLEAGTGLSVARSGDKITFTNTVADTTLSTENVQDIVGGMFSSNTETGITATYEDGDGTIDLVVGSGVIVNSMLAADSVTAAKIGANEVNASELNVSGNGSTSQFLRSDGDGTFTWATPTDTNTTYSAGTGMSLSGTTFACTVTDTNTTYSAGSGIGLSGTTFSVAVNASGGSNLTQDANGVSLTATPTFTTVTATGDITANTGSDMALKENIINIPNPLEKISKIGGYMFDWKDHGMEDVHGKGHDTGIIAQEIEEILPEIVNTRESGMKAVNYMKLIPLLVESIKELKTELDELKSSNS